MPTAASHRVAPGVLWGTIGALALATLIVLTGGSSAHADEAADGPLDSITNLVGGALDSGADVVSDVVTETVAPVVETVLPVAETVLPVAETVVPVVTETVPDVLQDSPVSSLTDPLLDTVSNVPVVGNVLDSLAVPDAVREVAGAVDTTTGLLGTTIDTVIPPVVNVIDPTSPVAPEGVPTEDRPLTPVTPSVSTVTSTTAVAHSGVALSGARVLYALADQNSATEAANEGAAGPTAPSGAAHAPLGPPAPSSSVGHGGGSTADGARLRDASADSLRVWKRTVAVTDDDLPSSPVTDTDTSPD